MWHYNRHSGGDKMDKDGSEEFSEIIGKISGELLYIDIGFFAREAGMILSGPKLTIEDSGIIFPGKDINDEE